MKRRTFFGTVAAAAVAGVASTVKAEASSGKRNLERTMEELTEGKTTLKLNGDPGKDTVVFCMRTWTESPTETPPIKTVWVGHAADTERFIAMANASTRVKRGPHVSTTLTVVDQHRQERVYGMWRGSVLRHPTRRFAVSDTDDRRSPYWAEDEKLNYSHSPLDI